MLPPLDADEMVVIIGVVDGICIWFDDDATLPAYVNDEGPFPSTPSVTM